MSQVNGNSDVKESLDNIEANTKPSQGSPYSVGQTITTTTATILGSDLTRKALFLQARKTNTDDIYVSFATPGSIGNAVVILSPGDSWSTNEYNGVLYATAASGNQVLQVANWYA